MITRGAQVEGGQLPSDDGKLPAPTDWLILLPRKALRRQVSIERCQYDEKSDGGCRALPASGRQSASGPSALYFNVRMTFLKHQYRLIATR